MKKVLLTVTIFLILSMVCISSFAETSNDFSKKDAEYLVRLAINLHDDFYTGTDMEILSEKEIYMDSFHKNSYFILDKEKPLSDTVNFLGENPHQIKSYYFEGENYPIGTAENLMMFLKKIYTENAIESEAQNYSLYDPTWMFINEKKVYFVRSGADLSWPSKYYDITNFSVKENIATANVIMRQYLPNDTPEKYYEYYSYPVQFAKTADGWRIDSRISQLQLHDKQYRIDNPSTSSPTLIYLTIAGAALVGVCLPVVKRKRRFCCEA